MNNWPINPEGRRRPNLSWIDRNPLQRVEPGTPPPSRGTQRHEVDRLSDRRKGDWTQSDPHLDIADGERDRRPGGDTDGDFGQHIAAARTGRRLHAGVSRYRRRAACGRTAGRGSFRGGFGCEPGRRVAGGDLPPSRAHCTGVFHSWLPRSDRPGSGLRSGGSCGGFAGGRPAAERSGSCVDDRRGWRRGSGFTRGGALRGARRNGGLHR